MQIESRAVDRIIPYDSNPRNIGEDAINAVAKSIVDFGFRQPIVVDDEGVIIVGHVRYWAAKKLGMPEVPVHVAADLPPDKVKAYRLADNKSGELSSWDMYLLTAEIKSLEGAMDLSQFGFDEKALADLTLPLDVLDQVNETKSTAQLSLKFGKYSVPLDETEFGTLVKLLTDYENKIGTRYGFIASLTEQKKNVEV